MRLIYLSSYDKNGKTAPPSKPAGEDGLGDLVVEPSDQRQKVFDSLDLKPNGIKKVETDRRLLKLKPAQQHITLSPIYLPSFTPIEGPQFCQQLHQAVCSLSGFGRFKARYGRNERR